MARGRSVARRSLQTALVDDQQASHAEQGVHRREVWEQQHLPTRAPRPRTTDMRALYGDRDLIGNSSLACKSALAYHELVTDVFDALAAPARRAILDVLAQREQQTLFEICGRLAAEHDVELTRQAISQHLAVLEDAGLVRSWRDGRYKFHSIDTAPLQTALERWLKQR